MEMRIAALAARIRHMDDPTARWMILVVGPVRYGKSTLTRYISRRLGVTPVAFGDAIRERARALGLPADRASWQRVGERWVDEDPRGLSDTVLAPVREQPLVVVDGVRHWTVYDLLRSLAGDRHVALIYVDADLATRRARLEADGVCGAAAEEVLAHSTETELPMLRAAADIVADGTGGAGPVQEALMNLMKAGGLSQNNR